MEERNGNKYLTLVSTDESKGTLKKYEKLWHKIKGIINLNLNNEKFTKIKFNSDDDLPFKNAETL